MNVQATARARGRWFRQIDVARFRQRGWWVILLLAAGTIVVGAFVGSWTECRYIHQVELDQYLSDPGAVVRQPERRPVPVLTVLIRVGGQLLASAGAWVGWTGGLALISPLLGEGKTRFGTLARVVSWSWLPIVLRGVIQCLYMYLAGDPIYNPGLSGLVLDSTPPPPGGGYGYVTPTPAQQLWAVLLARLDVYLFAHLALLVRGLRRASGLQRRKALIVTSIVGLCLGGAGILVGTLGGTLGHLRLF
jgi:hypothetical protein